MSSPRPHFTRAETFGTLKGARPSRVARARGSGTPDLGRAGACGGPPRHRRVLVRAVVVIEVAMCAGVACALAAGPPWTMLALGLGIVALSGLERRAWSYVS